MHRWALGGGAGGRSPPKTSKWDPPSPLEAKNLVIKTRSFIPTPEFFFNPYVVNLILYVVTEIFYDPPPSAPDLAHLWMYVL